MKADGPHAEHRQDKGEEGCCQLSEGKHQTGRNKEADRLHNGREVRVRFDRRMGVAPKEEAPEITLRGRMVVSRLRGIR